MRFDKVLLVGSNKIACDCARHLKEILDYHKIFVLESDKNTSSMLKALCQKTNIFYENLTQKNEIEKFILDFIKDKAVLIISANNRFIFTPNIIDSKNVEIINFHYALLPKYRGMNIPTWVIFNDEKQTGISWHFVTKYIDKGKIIVQKKIDIKSHTNALEIVRKGMELAFVAFKEFIGDLLEKKLDGFEVDYSSSNMVYKFDYLPLDALLLQNLNLRLISRFLRCFDYGGLGVIKKPNFIYDDKCFEIEKYKIAPCEFEGFKIELKGDVLSVCENNTQIIIKLLKVDEMTSKEIISKINELKNATKAPSAGGGGGKFSLK